MKRRFDLDDARPKKNRFGLETDASKVKKRKSMAQEDRVASRGGGKRVPASGALPGKTGDVSGVSKFLIECKRTNGIGLYLSDKQLRKAESEAADAGCVPAIAFELEGRQKGRREWVLLPDDVFYAMIELVGAEFDKWA